MATACSARWPTRWGSDSPKARRRTTSPCGRGLSITCGKTQVISGNSSRRGSLGTHTWSAWGSQKSGGGRRKSVQPLRSTGASSPALPCHHRGRRRPPLSRRAQGRSGHAASPWCCATSRNTTGGAPRPVAKTPNGPALGSTSDSTTAVVASSNQRRMMTSESFSPKSKTRARQTERPAWMNPRLLHRKSRNRSAKPGAR
mmetsp:Transcript_25423/g.64574  ORF Transcript_25423/g.64574 Transcript_25423/m.64574 type:complete len:200 (+) Transcript_25423:538-1137(+)